jgi:hypothetical protein
MAKQGEKLQQQTEEKRGTGEISYPVDDVKDVVRKCSQRGPREEKTRNRNGRDEPHQRIRERNALKMKLLNPSPIQNGCV